MSDESNRPHVLVQATDVDGQFLVYGPYPDKADAEYARDTSYGGYEAGFRVTPLVSQATDRQARALAAEEVFFLDPVNVSVYRYFGDVCRINGVYKGLPDTNNQTLYSEAHCLQSALSDYIRLTRPEVEYLSDGWHAPHDRDRYLLLTNALQRDDLILPMGRPKLNIPLRAVHNINLGACGGYRWVHRKHPAGRTR